MGAGLHGLAAAEHFWYEVFDTLDTIASDYASGVKMSPNSSQGKVTLMRDRLRLLVEPDFASNKINVRTFLDSAECETAADTINIEEDANGVVLTFRGTRFDDPKELAKALVKYTLGVN